MLKQQLKLDKLKDTIESLSLWVQGERRKILELVVKLGQNAKLASRKTAILATRQPKNQSERTKQTSWLISYVCCLLPWPSQFKQIFLSFSLKRFAWKEVASTTATSEPLRQQVAWVNRRLGLAHLAASESPPAYGGNAPQHFASVWF